MSPEFANWVTGKNLGFSHETDGKDAEEAHDLIKVFVDNHPATIVIERANVEGEVCQFWSNRYEADNKSDSEFDSEALRYQRYWKSKRKRFEKKKELKHC